MRVSSIGRSVVAAVTILSSLLLLSVVSGAQELGIAVLSGDVTDPQGAVVIGAQVTARSVGTGVQRTSVTNHVGLFVFNNLAPGPYEVRVEASGFAPAQSTVRLEVGQQASLKFPLTIEQEKTTIVIDDR
ncbi:MAG TPA: carboxypeptidase-like regulatory domain-containing protein, partial [Terriglobales bacterium]|nr:carboxypeptidase-like regulatory domain-containing protein [Terriglobales bacterium]